MANRRNRDAAESGDYLRALRASRDTMAEALDGDNPNVWAQTNAQYLKTLELIEAEVKAQKLEEEDADGAATPDTPDEAY
jgi:hypothetical protein